MSKVNDFIRDMYVNLEAQKEALLMEKLKEFGIECSYDSESGRRFPRFSIERHRLDGLSHEERYYYNDGSRDGKLIMVLREVVKNDPTEMSFGYKVEVEVVEPK